MDRWIGAIFSLSSAYLLWTLRNKSGEAVGFPAALLVLLLVLSLILIISTPAGSKGFPRSKPVWAAMLLAAVYLLALPRVGFIISTVVMLCAALWVSGFRLKGLMLPVLVAAVVAAIYVPFKIWLMVPLP